MTASRGDVFETLPVAAMLLREDRVVAVNPAYERFMSISADQVVGRTVLDMVGQFVTDNDTELSRTAAESFRSGQAPAGEVWIRMTDAAGRPRPVRVEWRPSGNEGETVTYLVDAEGEAVVRAAADGLARGASELGSCHDETEVLERAADLLHMRGLGVMTLLLKDDDPLLAYGPMRFFATADRAKQASLANAILSARPRREVLWELNRDFPSRRAAFFQDLRAIVHAVFPPHIAEQVLALSQGQRRVQAPVFVNGAPYGALILSGESLNPALTGSLELFAELVARAIENVRLRNELVQRERLAALGEAAAVMAHEVRNPITAILNAETLLKKESVDAESKQALVVVIGEEARRLERLVNDLLDLGRPLAPRLKPVDLYELASRSANVLGARGETGDVEIVVVPPRGRVLASLDPELAQLALWNVIRNAAQASPKGSRVNVFAESRGPQAALVIDDRGPGFPPESAERILEPFHTTRATGTGIGLAVVRRVVEACKGTIELGRSPPGGGRFVMLFPSEQMSR